MGFLSSVNCDGFCDGLTAIDNAERPLRASAVPQRFRLTEATTKAT